MSKSNQPRLKAAHTTAQLDALFTRAISADQRANKPASHTPLQERHLVTTSDTPDQAATASAESVTRQGGAGDRRGRIQQQVLPLERMQRLTVRFTRDEARLLEKARGVAREMGFKISDTAVFRLALNLFKPEAMTPDNLKAVLAADNRRKSG